MVVTSEPGKVAHRPEKEAAKQRKVAATQRISKIGTEPEKSPTGQVGAAPRKLDAELKKSYIGARKKW